MVFRKDDTISFLMIMNLRFQVIMQLSFLPGESLLS